MNRRLWMLGACLTAGLLAVLGLSAGVEGSGGSGSGASDFKVTRQTGQIILYCGRSKALVDPLVERFERETGIQVAVRYGRDAQLIAALAEEGTATSADVFWANTTGALGAAVNQDMLGGVSSGVLSKPSVHTPAGGKWVPVTMRFRVLAYNPQKVKPEDLPKSVMDLAKAEQFRGRIGWTPAYSSFQDFVTAMRVMHGREATLAWLKGVKQLDAKSYGSNTPMMAALTAGEIDIALTNHYYILRVKAEDASAPLAMAHFEPGDVGNLALVTGAGVVKGSSNGEAANKFLAFLLSADAQGFAARQVNEIPVVQGVALPAGLAAEGDEALKLSPSFDMERLQELGDTLGLMQEAGLF